MSSLEFTPLEAIPSIAARVRKTFNEQTTKPIEYRLLQLRKLYWGLKDNADAIVEACRLDLGKPYFEAYAGEVGWCMNDIIYTCKNLRRWAKDETPEDIALLNKALSPKIRKDPLGAVLVIGPFNYPVHLSLGPLIGAIAAGCTAVLKPPENAPHSADVIQRIIEQSLDPRAYAVVQGGARETTALLDEKWDKIFYTGSGRVGRIVAQKAAATLTPVTLELGGQNPAVVTKHADARLAARRLLWGKVNNAGQVCMAENYVLVDKDVTAAFLAELKIALDEFFPGGVRTSPDYGRIVNQHHFRRLKALLDNTRGKVLLGGAMDEGDRFIEPTFVLVDDIRDPLMAEEIFGPLVSIYPVENLDEAIRIANEVNATPLAVYPFGNKEETEKILGGIRSGGASVNDAYVHGIISTLPFGGVGESGQGSYRGKASFECFSHRRSMTTTPSWMERFLAVRYPPYTPDKVGKFRKMSELKPNFDRDGRETSGAFGARWLWSLGAGSVKGALGRYMLLVLLTVSIERYLAQKRRV